MLHAHGNAPPQSHGQCSDGPTWRVCGVRVKVVSYGVLALLAVSACAPQQRVPKQSSDASESQDRAVPIPFFDSRRSVAGYNGPGREDPAPEGIEEVGIAWFGPRGDDAGPANGMWNAATLALSEINDAGGKALGLLYCQSVDR